MLVSARAPFDVTSPRPLSIEHHRPCSFVFVGSTIHLNEICANAKRGSLSQVCLFIYFFLYPPASGTTSTFQSTARAVPNLQPDVGEKGSGLNCVIGFADLHGDVVKAREVLEASGASNTTHLWAAGECTLVQTGDLVDRGPDSVGVTKLFEDVKTAAADAGGHVVTLLGNHELMNLQVRQPFYLNSRSRCCNCAIA